MRIWKSADGKRRINLDMVVQACCGNKDDVFVFVVGDTDDDHAATLRGDDAASFLAALDAAAGTSDDLTRKLDILAASLNELSADIGSVGVPDLMVVVKDIVTLLKVARRMHPGWRIELEGGES